MRWILCAVVLAAVISVRLQAQTEVKQAWRFPLEGFATFSSPALSPDETSIYVGVQTGLGGGRLMALSPQGEERWAFPRAQPIDATPVVAADGTVYIGCVDGWLYALDPSKPASATAAQRIKWAFNARNFVSSSPAIGKDGTLYFGDGDGDLNAVAADGTERWTLRLGGAGSSAIVASPVIGHDGTIYVGSTDAVVYAIRPDQSEKWRFSTGAPIFAAPAIGSDGTIYVVSTDQKVYALAPEEGGRKWEFLTNGAIDASPAIAADGTVYVVSNDGNCYALKPNATNEDRVKWVSHFTVTSASSPSVRADGAIIFGADDNSVRALNPANGELLWRFNPNQFQRSDVISSSPLIAPDGSIYVGSWDGWFYKITGNGSPLSTVSTWPTQLRTTSRGGRAEEASGEGRLVNVSVRAHVATNQQLIVGFFVQTAGVRLHLVRAAGPTLGDFGVGGFMPDPKLQVYAGTTLVERERNDDWGVQEGAVRSGMREAELAVGAFPLRDGSKDAALLTLLRGGDYSTIAESADGRPGVVLVEAYDAIVPEVPARLVNVSARHQVGTGDNVLIAGFVVEGTRPVRLLARGVGPGLAQFGVAGVLARPSVTLFDSNGVVVRTNGGWTTGGIAFDLASAAGLVGAFPLRADNVDAAMVVTVAPGAYTLQVAGQGGTVGEALAEVYQLP